MNKEEQEAIEYIKAFQKDLYGASEKNLMAIYIDRIWNYIDKLQKENEELKKQVDIEFVEENYIEKSKVISKDKIRDKIKELEEIKNQYNDESLFDNQISVLKELLEEE